MSSSRAPFDLPELLEMILLHVPLKTLLNTRRVNKQFRDAITTSSKLQRVLFLKHDPSVEELEWLIIGGGAVVGVQYPIHQTPSSEAAAVAAAEEEGEELDGDDDDGDDDDEDDEDEVGIPHRRLVINPLLVQGITSIYHWAYEDWSIALNFRLPLARFANASTPSVNGFSTNFCGRMFITQPPVTSIMLRLNFAHNEATTNKRVWEDEVVNPNGITFQDVLRVVQQAPSYETAKNYELWPSDPDIAFVTPEERVAVEG